MTLPVYTGLRVMEGYVRVERPEYNEYFIVTRRPLLRPLAQFPRIARVTLRSILLALPNPREEIG
jgi:hypothetical protein